MLCVSSPSVILGVTNPFFAKTLQHWPHIIRIGDMKQAGTELYAECLNPFICQECRLYKDVLVILGEMAKQMKVKKLKNLKTLDSKPGKHPLHSL